MDIRLLRYAVTLSEELHFGRAAEREFISPQPFGRIIQRLEREVGTDLFIRTSHRVELTEAGRLFIARARPILVSMEELARIGRPQEHDDALMIGVLGFGLADHSAEFLELLRAQAPGISLTYTDLDFINQYVSVQTNQADAGIVQHIGPVDDLAFDDVIALPRVAVVPAQSRLATADRLSHEDLLTVGTIAFPQQLHQSFYGWAGVTAIPGTIGIRGPASIAAAVAATGRAAIHADAAARYYPHPEARYVPLEGPPVLMALATRVGDERPAVIAARRAAQSLAKTLPCAS